MLEGDVDTAHDEVSHGYCPTCTERAFEEIRALHRDPAFQARAVVNC